MPSSHVELGRFRLPLSVKAAVTILEAFTVDYPDATCRQRGPVVIIETKEPAQAALPLE